MMMGIGPGVVTLESSCIRKLRDVNVARWKSYRLEAFRTEFYPTYDLYPIIKDKLADS
mgnify:CR=1 FL=1